jgi:anaerobic selenocysteine-containing dehydrogenase
MGDVVRYTNGTTGGPVFVDVKDGKILRITPMEFDESDAPSWTISARGQKFTPPRKTTASPWTVAHRSTIYSSKRILTPLKRVDFDPKGERNPQNRGTSGYEPISWDAALDIVADEMIRLKREVGPAAVLTTPGSHHMWGNVGYRHSAYFRFMNLLGFTYGEHNPDSWEGWHWGAMHMWGNSHRLGISEQYGLLEDALKNSELIIYWSADPEATCNGVYGGHEGNVRRRWLKDLGVRMIVIDPYFNHTGALLCDKWFSPRMGTDVAMGLGIAHTWLTEDLYDKEYVATRTTGFDEWKDYVLGKTDGVPKTPEWAEKESAIAARDIRALAREWASKRPCWPPAARGGWAAPAGRRSATSGREPWWPSLRCRDWANRAATSGAPPRGFPSTAASCSPDMPRVVSPATRSTPRPASGSSTACSRWVGPR